MVQPLGSFVSGMLQDFLGRKVCMMMVNIPQLIAWIMMYRATSVTTLFVANIIMGNLLNHKSFTHIIQTVWLRQRCYKSSITLPDIKNVHVGVYRGFVTACVNGGEVLLSSVYAPNLKLLMTPSNANY